MASKKQRRHYLFTRLFIDGDDKGLYHSIVLEGARQRELTELIAYTAFYGEALEVIWRSESDDFNWQTERDFLLRQRLDPAQLAQQYTQALNLSPDANIAGFNSLLWRLVLREVEPRELPVGFLTRLRTLEGAPKSVFWFTKHAPADWLLEQIKERFGSDEER